MRLVDLGCRCGLRKDRASQVYNDAVQKEEELLKGVKPGCQDSLAWGCRGGRMRGHRELVKRKGWREAGEG